MKPHTSPKDFFLYIAAMVSLYISASSLTALLFQIINIKLPDQLDYYYDPYSTGIRFAIASLLIIFPLYLVISWYLNRELKTNPNKRDIGIRKWLVYLTIFAAGAIVVGDLVVLINTFLGGEITSRFFLKVLVVLIVSLAVFSYYGLDLKNRLVGRGKIFAVTSIVIALLSIIFGFTVLGSPLTQRKLRLDEQRVGDLQTIQWQIINYWQAKNMLPNALTALENPISGFRVPADPITKSPYEYRKTRNLAFELCATFARPSSSTNRSATPRPVPLTKSLEGEAWDHEAGRHCFIRTIDPDLYPVRTP